MKIIYVIISGIVSAFSVLLTASNLTKEKLNFKSVIKFLIIFIPIAVLACLYLEGISKIIMTVLITAISLYFSFFKKQISKSVYYSLTYEILAFLSELIFSIILLAVGIDTTKLNTIEIAVLISTIFSCLGIYFLSKVKYIQNVSNKFYKIVCVDKGEWIYVFLVSILMILLVTFNRYNISNNISFYINVSMFIFVFITLIFVIFNKIKMDNVENKYNEMMDYVSKYEKVINEQGKKNHEYNNQLMVIKGYLKNPKKLEEYLNLVIEDHKCGQNYLIKQLSYFPDGGIKGLIYHKLSKMEENNIKPYLYIDSKIKGIFEEKLDVATYKDITKLLGVFLDNAVEAAKETKKKEIDFDIKKDDTCLIITISNTYNNQNDINQVGKKGFSTKGAGHGFGLSIVKDISKNNNNIETFNSIENDKFKQTIIIYYQK